MNALTRVAVAIFLAQLSNCALMRRDEPEPTGSSVEIMDVDGFNKGRAISNFEDNYNQDPFIQGRDGSPCCHKIQLESESDHGIWMIHFNKLGTYTITNTLVEGRNTWVSDADPEFVITWCGSFWHVGHRGEAGKCNGYISSPQNNLCFEHSTDLRYYVHCINEWVDAAPSGLRINCLNGPRSAQEKIDDIDPRNNAVDSDDIVADEAV